MTKLYLGGEHFGTRPNAPRYDRFEESTGLDGIAEGILLYTTNLEKGNIVCVSLFFFLQNYMFMYMAS